MWLIHRARKNNALFVCWLKRVCGNIQYWVLFKYSLDFQWSVYWLCVVVVCRRKDWLLENTCIFMVRNDVHKRILTILILYHSVQSIIAMTSRLAFHSPMGICNLIVGISPRACWVMILFPVFSRIAMHNYFVRMCTRKTGEAWAPRLRNLALATVIQHGSLSPVDFVVRMLDRDCSKVSSYAGKRGNN